MIYLKFELNINENTTVTPPFIATLSGKIYKITNNYINILYKKINKNKQPIII